MFLLNPSPVSAKTAQAWGVVGEVTADGRALDRAREIAKVLMKAPEVTRRNTRAHFILPLKIQIVSEVSDGLSLEGASAASLVKSMQANK
jgi:enoyl-CoA hydratase/carnithine racemase